MKMFANHIDLTNDPVRRHKICSCARIPTNRASKMKELITGRSPEPELRELTLQHARMRPHPRYSFPIFAATN